MAYDPKALQRYSTNLLANGTKIHHFTYATNDTLAEVTTAGYFNSGRSSFTVSSIVHLVADVDGTPNYATLKMATVPATGNVTCAVDTPAA